MHRAMDMNRLPMLKITLHDSAREFRLKLEGRLSGPWVHELEQCWMTASSTTHGRNTVLDLGEVDFVDLAGESLLARWWQSKELKIASAVTSLLLAVVADKLTKLDLLGWLWARSGRLWSAMIAPIKIPILVFVIGLIVLGVAALAYLNRKKSPSARFMENARSNTALETRPEVGGELDVGALLRAPELPQRVVLRLMGYQNDNPLLVYQYGLCGSDYEPGTFTLEEIAPGSAFLRLQESMDVWLSRVVSDELALIETHHADLIGDRTSREITQQVGHLLLCGVEGSLPSLGHATWYQEYSDIILRLIATVLTGD